MSAPRGDDRRAGEGHYERRPCPHGCAGGHTEDEYWGGDCRSRDQEAFEGFRDEDRQGHYERRWQG